MKKIYKLLLTLSITTGVFNGLRAQVSTYVFSQNMGSYTAITGGSVIATATATNAAGTLDNFVYNLPASSFPFTFMFNAVGYTGCNISTNGFITFGATAPGTTNYTPISSTAGYNGVISAWGINSNSMYSAGTGSLTGEIRFEVVGSAPNREAVIQYSNWRPTNSTSLTDVYGMNFQIRLQETTNKITIMYGSNSYVAGSSVFNNTSQIGLRGNSNTDYHNRLNSSILSFTSSTAGTANNAVQTFSTSGTTPGMPVNGLTYLWTPPAPCSGPPTGGTTVASSTLLCLPQNVNLSLTGNTLLPDITFLWQSSPDGTTWTSIPTATNSTTSQSVTATTYYQCILSCSTSTAASTPILVNYNPVINTIPYNEGFEGITANNQLPNCSWVTSSPGSICLTYTASGTSNRMPKTGTRFASFRYGTNGSGDYFYTNGLQLTAGTTYSISTGYITDGVSGWSSFSLLMGTSQSSSGLTNIVSVSNPINTTYATASGIFTAPTSGVYYLAVKTIGSFAPNYLSFDDISVSVTASPAVINSLTLVNPSNQCVAVAHTINAGITPGGNNLTSVVLNYAFNGIAQPTLAMTGGSVSSASSWSATIPAASPVNASVTWTVTTADGLYTIAKTGASYLDQPLLGYTTTATAVPNLICGVGTTTLSIFPITSSTYAAPPAVSNPTTDEDFGNITFGPLNNTSTINSLVGTIGTASGTAGSYSNFTAFGPYNFTSGNTYSLSLSSLTTGTSYGNAFGVYIDYNRNGVFTDAGEAIYVSSLTTSGPHTETANITIPLTAIPGLTRLRVISNEGTVSGPSMSVSWGEYEEYTLNIISNFTSFAWSDGASTVATTSVAVLSPPVTTSYSLTATDINGCSVVSSPVTVTVTPIPLMPSVSNSTLCGVGVSAASVTGGSSYNWYATPTSTLALQSNASSTYTSAIGATTTFYVSSAVGICESPRAAVTTTVSIPDLVIATTTSANICPGGSVGLNAVQTGSNNTYAFNWDASTPIGSGMPSSIAGGTITVIPTIAGVYVYSVTASDGICTTISSVSVALNNPPAIIATASPTVVCSGAPVNLNAVTVAAGTVTLGVGSTTSSSGGSPFYHGWGGAKVQYIYTAAELMAQGFAPGNITSFGLNVTSVGIPYEGFAINVGTTTQSSFSSANTINGLTQVYTGPGTNNSYLPTTGINTFNFSTPIYWNGTDNIVVSICWSNATFGGSSSAVSWDTYASNVGMYIYADSQTPSTVCGATTTIPASGNSSTTTGRPRTFFSGQKSVLGDGGLTWQWNPGAINTNTAVVNPVNAGTLPVNQTYTVTAYNPVTTCSNVASVTVSVNPLPATPTVVNSIQCGLAIPTAAVNGGTFYNWYATPTSTAVLQGSAINTFTNAISATTDYYVSSYNGICESVRAMVTASVTIPDLVTAISTASAVCPGESYTLTAVKTGTANTYNYTWTATPATGSGIPTSVTGAAPVISPITPGNHTYLVTAVDGSCTATASVNVLLNLTPSISASSTPTVVCSSNSVTLNAISIAATASTAPSGTVSLGSITGGPYRQGAGSDNKAQYLFTAAELTAAGFAPGNITALSFNVTFNGSGTMNNFTIRMGNTSTTSFGTTYDAAPAIVFGPVAYTTTAGLNTHTFSTPFYWNGTSNVVVQVCHDVVSGGGSSTIDQQTIANRVIYSNTSGACALTTGTSGSSRAVVTFAGQVGTNVTSSMNFLWNPGSIATNTAIVNPVNLGSTPITTIYSVTVTNPSTSCTNATTVGVLVNPIPVAPTAFNSIQCGVAVPTASVTGGIGYHWYNAATTGTLVQSGTSQTYTNVISAPTDYYVASFDGNCESPRTMVTASVNIPDAVTASVLTASICPNTATTLTVTQTGSTNNYSYTWVGIPTIGSGISTALTGSSVSVMPTLPGNYVYSVTAVDLAACTAVSTTTLNVFQALTVAPLAVSSPSALCTGGTATLSGTFGGTLAPSYTTPPAVISPTTDEDIANVTFGLLANTTTTNSLVGTIGTAAGTAGSYSDFTAFGPYNYTAGSTYSLSLTSIQLSGTFSNAFAVYIDYNRNGVFTDAGELVYLSAVTTPGNHTETANITIPATAQYGLTRMRVICNEGLVSSSTMVVSYGEYEEYTLNIRPNVAYTWSDGASVIGTTPTITQTPSTATTYSFAVIDPNGCAINSLPVTVNINPIPTVSVTASSPTVCANSPVILTGGGATTYSWAPVGGGSVTATVNPSVTTTYTVTGTSLGCSSTNTISLAVTPTPTVIATSSNSVICLGASVTFTASGAVNYTWTPGSASTTTISVTPTVTSTYSVTGEDLGCTTTKTLSVTVNRIPTLTVTPSSTICIGGSKTLNVSGATTYAWSTGSSAVAIVVSPTISSTYTVSGTNSCGTSTATTMVSVASTPVISAVTSNTLLCVGETATLSVSGTATSYSWSAGGGSSSNIVVSPTSNTTYTVTGTSICGTATTTVIQNVSPCTSVQELASTQISLYPNPTTGFVNISMSRELLGGNTKIEVYDAIGKLVIVETLTNESTKLYTNKLEDGIYIYKVYDNNKIVTIGKLVKQ